MGYKIEISPDGEIDLAKLDKSIYLRIKKKIQFFAIQENPMLFAEALTGLRNRYKWRVGKWRIIFEQKPKTLELTLLWILEVDNRDTIYKNLR